MTTLRDLKAGLSMLQAHRYRAEAKRHTLELCAWDALIGAAEAVIACHEAETLRAPGLRRAMQFGPTRLAGRGGTELATLRATLVSPL